MTSLVSQSDHKVLRVMGAFFKKFIFQITIILIAIQLSLAASWGWTWLLFWNHMFGYVFIKIATVVGSALLAGLISRVILKDHFRILRWLSAQISVIFSLVGLSLLTKNLVGFPLTFTIPSTTNWDGLWQLCVGCLITWLVLYAWSKPRQPGITTGEPARIQDPSPMSIDTVVQPVTQVTLPVSPVMGSEMRTRMSPVNRMRADNPKEANPSTNNFLHAVKKKAAQWIEQIHPPADWRKSFGMAGHDPSTVPGKNNRKEAKPDQRTVISRKHKSIRLVGQEEHRCPYCLELVEENDPAGVVVCPICHANHHKGCWEVTGNCQVPHSQN